MISKTPLSQPDYKHPFSGEVIPNQPPRIFREPFNPGPFTLLGLVLIPVTLCMLSSPRGVPFLIGDATLLLIAAAQAIMLRNRPAPLKFAEYIDPGLPQTEQERIEHILDLASFYIRDAQYDQARRTLAPIQRVVVACEWLQKLNEPQYK